MIVTMMLAWHAAAILIGMFLIGALVRQRVQNLTNQRYLYEIVESKEPLNEKESYDMEDSLHYHNEEILNKYSASNFKNIVDSNSDINA